MRPIASVRQTELRGTRFLRIPYITIWPCGWFFSCSVARLSELQRFLGGGRRLGRVRVFWSLRAIYVRFFKFLVKIWKKICQFRKLWHTKQHAHGFLGGFPNLAGDLGEILNPTGTMLENLLVTLVFERKINNCFKMSEENWSFLRLGYNKAEQIFVLESHLSPIKVGRATFNDLQCKGEL